jgi:hypothetical protein
MKCTHSAAALLSARLISSCLFPFWDSLQGCKTCWPLSMLRYELHTLTALRLTLT